MAIAHRLAHRDQIGNEAVAGKAPHLLAGAAETGLHLVGDEEAAGRTHRFDRGTQEAAGSANTPSLEKMVSTNSPAGRMPFFFMSSSAPRTCRAKISPVSSPAERGAGTSRAWPSFAIGSPSEGDNSASALVTP